MKEQYLTHEVGSLEKREWRVKAIAGDQINNADIQDAIVWGERLGIDYKPLVDVLNGAREMHSGEKLSLGQRRVVRDAAGLYATRLQEEAGILWVWDGEQFREEMYKDAVKKSNGFEFRGQVRVFDNRFYDKYAVVDTPSITKPWHVDELLRLQEITKHPIKVPITGAYTIAAWSYDEFYNRKKSLGTQESRDAQLKAREEFVLDVSRNLIRPNIEALIEKGAKWIQIDEPAATTIPSEVPLFVKSFNESVKGLSGAEFSVHICYSDYSLLFPYVQEMENCAQYSLELANKDSRQLGTQDGQRPGYEVLKLFKKFNVPGRIGLGVVDIHSDYDESPELVRDRILYATRILEDPNRINPSPDCGLRTRTWEVAFKKMSAVVKGARLAEEKI